MMPLPDCRLIAPSHNRGLQRSCCGIVAESSCAKDDRTRTPFLRFATKTSPIDPNEKTEIDFQRSQYVRPVGERVGRERILVESQPKLHGLFGAEYLRLQHSIEGKNSSEK